MQIIQLIRELNTPFRRENKNNNINNNNRNNNSGDMLLLIYLFTTIIHTECDASKANQMVIRSWYEFANKLENQINQTLRDQKKSKHRSSKKSAMSEVYDILLNHFTDMIWVALKKRVEKVNKIYTLFKEISVNNIERVSTFSADKISEFNISQIDYIIKNVTI